jgi:CRISPR system Cascade subunit CasB
VTETITSAGAAPARRAPRWAGVLHRTLTRIHDDPAALAACRRGVGKQPFDVPAMWPYLAPALDAIPEAQAGRRAIEVACHHALALYATHQQSRPEPMHVREPGGRRDSLGRACSHLSAALDRKGRSEAGVTRRFVAAATAESVEELAGHLRGLIPQLREHRIPLDYVQLAQDLAAWHRPERRAWVRRRWGLDFYRREVPGNDQHEENANGLA